MDDKKLIQNLKTLPLYSTVMEKLTIAPNQLDENEKTFASQYLGKEIEVLFENEAEGHTTNYMKVMDARNQQKAGTIKKVLAKEWKKNCLYIE